MLILHTSGRLLSGWLITHTLHRSALGTFLLLPVSLKTQWSVSTGFTGRHTSVCPSVCVGPDSHNRQNSPGFRGRSDSNMVMQKQVIEIKIKKEQRKQRRGAIDREAEEGGDWEVCPRHFLTSNNSFFYFQTFGAGNVFFLQMKFQNCALKQYYLGFRGSFCVFWCSNDRQLPLWLRRKSGATLKAIMSQHSVPASSFSVPRLVILTNSGFFAITRCKETTIFFLFKVRVILFCLLVSEQGVSIPGWRRGAFSLVSCSIFTLMDSLASRDGGFISNHLQQTHAGTLTHEHPHSKQEVVWACRAE